MDERVEILSALLRVLHIAAADVIMGLSPLVYGEIQFEAYFIEMIRTKSIISRSDRSSSLYPAVKLVHPRSMASCKVQLLQFNGQVHRVHHLCQEVRTHGTYDVTAVRVSENSAVIDWSFMGHAPASRQNVCCREM